MSRSNLIYRYWKVGKLLHFVAILAFSFALYSYSILQDLDFNSEFYLWLTWLSIFICFFNMSILAELDGYSRFQNYKQIKDQLYLNGYRDRLVRPLSNSSCQRAAVILASDELGFRSQVQTYFYNRGYRWYHVIPDFILKNPLFFFTKYFWRTTFFAPRYQPKIKYEQLQLSGNR